MKIFFLAVVLYSIEWVYYPEKEWEFLLGNKYLFILVLSGGLFLKCKESLIEKSAFALLFITALADCISSFHHMISDKVVDFSIPFALIFFIWMLFLIRRNYPETGDKINPETVNILILKPRNEYEVFKTLIGAPVASICILADGFVWAYRRHSGEFEKSKYNESWLSSHIVHDTGIICNGEILDILESLLCKNRFPFCKCVYTIRGVLNRLGGKYKIKTWFDYIPGIYASRILKG